MRAGAESDATSGTASCFWLVVTEGADAGSRIAIDGRTRSVGRTRAADLALTDRSVSRRHLEITASAGGVAVRVCDGAKPFLIRGRAMSEAEAFPGDKIIVGNTVLYVIEAPAQEPSARAEVEVTDMAVLLGGPTADAHGFAAIFALSEALDAAEDRAALDRALGEWARKHAGAVDAALVQADGTAEHEDMAQLIARPNELIERTTPGEPTATIAVPAHTTVPGAVVFHVAAERLSDAVRRLCLVAGRVCASSLARLALAARMEEDNAALRRIALGSAQQFLGSSPAAQQIAKLVPRLAASEAVVLLLGESGSGKTFVARLIHEAGARAREPLRVINCAAIPENLLEAELFGHERGAFTGAVAARAGAFEAAGRGTVLLDEIGELPLTSQAKLLRVLEDKLFERIGSNRPLTLRARVLTATNRDLQAMVAAGRFRSDLYFRISVVSVRVPPLRERGDDVVLLARQTLADLAPTAGRRVTDLSPAAVEAVRRYGWPGNVRELRNAIEHALVLGDGATIEPSDLPEAIRGAPPAQTDPDAVRLPAKLEWLEARAIEAALRVTGGNRTRAAALLGINRVTLYKKLREDPADR